MFVGVIENGFKLVQRKRPLGSLQHNGVPVDFLWVVLRGQHLHDDLFYVQRVLRSDRAFQRRAVTKFKLIFFKREEPAGIQDDTEVEVLALERQIDEFGGAARVDQAAIFRDIEPARFEPRHRIGRHVERNPFGFFR